MKDYQKMINPDNKRRNNDNAIYGTINKVTDYHLIEKYQVENKTLLAHMLEKDEHIKKQNILNDKLIKVIENQNNEINKMKERLDKYGI